MLFANFYLICASLCAYIILLHIVIFLVSFLIVNEHALDFLCLKLYIHYRVRR
jgi:hypothetical protein